MHGAVDGGGGGLGAFFADEEEVVAADGGNARLAFVAEKVTIVLIMATAPSDLADLLFGRTRQRVLGFLYAHPTERIHLRQKLGG